MADDIVKRLLRATGECPCRRPTIGSQIISCCVRCDAEYAAAVVLEARDAEIERLRAKEQDLRMLLEQEACEIERLRGEIERLSYWHYRLAAALWEELRRG